MKLPGYKKLQGLRDFIWKVSQERIKAASRHCLSPIYVRRGSAESIKINVQKSFSSTKFQTYFNEIYHCNHVENPHRSMCKKPKEIRGTVVSSWSNIKIQIINTDLLFGWSVAELYSDGTLIFNDYGGTGVRIDLPYLSSQRFLWGWTACSLQDYVFSFGPIYLYVPSTELELVKNRPFGRAVTYNSKHGWTLSMMSNIPWQTWAVAPRPCAISNLRYPTNRSDRTTNDSNPTWCVTPLWPATCWCPEPL